MTTLTTGTKKVKVSNGTDGYGDAIFNAVLSQDYNNGLGIVERVIEMKSFLTENRAMNWAKKQLS